MIWFRTQIPSRSTIRSEEAPEEKTVVKENKKKSSAKDNAKATVKAPPSFDGLNEMESNVLKFIYEHSSVSVDGMSSLNIPVSKLLATVTMLEIKQKIIQKPGGYFEIK